MRRLSLAALLLLSVATAPALVAADDLIEQLATCKVSWLDWKDDPAQGRKFAESFNASFEQKERGPAWAPKKKVTVLGLPVREAFPESVGMGVGFSVTVDATFEKAKALVEKSVGKPLKDCDSGEGMRACELPVAEKRTVFLLTGDSGKGKPTTLLGCYYFYAR